MKQIGRGLVWKLSELEVNVVLLGVISDVHLDRRFPNYALQALFRRLQQFETAVKDLDKHGAGVLVILGDFIDFLTLDGSTPGGVPVIQDVMRLIRRLQASGVVVILLKGNHDRLLFDDDGLKGWWSTVLPPNHWRADWLFLEDDWLRVLFDHGHRWDITNREIFDQHGRSIKSLGDLVVERLIVPLQKECPDLNRIEPLYHIPLYLQQRDPGGQLLQRWLADFESLMKSPDFKRWRRNALPFAKRVLASMLPLFYDIYSTATNGSPAGLMSAMERISEFDRNAGDYLQKRQQELVAGKIGPDDYPPEWQSFIGDVRYIVNGHTHQKAKKVDLDPNGHWRGRISTGAWVKSLQLFPESLPPRSLTHFELTWTEFLISLTERRLMEIKQESPASIIF